MQLLINKRLKSELKSARVDETLIYQSTLTTDTEAPVNMTEQQIEEFVSSNLENFNGIISHTLNGEEFIRVTIVDGEETIEVFDITGRSMRGGCNYDAIQDCAQDIVYSSGVWSKLVCAFSGGSYILDAAIDCTLANCFGIE